MSKIILEDMEFYAFHGCLESEKQLGNTFWVSLEIELNTEKAARTDDLSDTLNYQLVYDMVKQQMAIRSNLIEHLSQRILDAIFDRFDVIETLKLRLSKANPPLGGKTKCVTIELSKNR